MLSWHGCDSTKGNTYEEGSGKGEMGDSGEKEHGDGQGPKQRSEGRAQLSLIRIGNVMPSVRILIVDPPPSQIPKLGKSTRLQGGVTCLVTLVMLT